MENHIRELKQYQSSQGSNVDLQVKQLTEELSKFKSMSKNRDNILNEIDSKNKSLRETETKLKLTQNDIEIMQTKARQQESMNKDLTEKTADLEKKVQQLRDSLS
mmetsp:Transcript_23965/g.36736  ORF Transcript_23965/g.36736 Transcript_23965/m.36736 type:complete len:105 (+) Transcript_23965:1294-1608(+)